MSDDEQQPKQPAKRQTTRRQRAIQIDAPGLEADISEETAQTFLDYTGSAWVWWSSPSRYQSSSSQYVWGYHG